MSDEKTLSAGRIEELRRLARDLIEHPESIPEAERRGDLAEMLGMLVALADLFLTPPFTLPDWMQRDSGLHDMMLDDFCRRYDEQGEIALTPILLPMLARRFREYFAQAVADGKGRKAGAQRVARAMAFFVDAGGWQVERAAERVAPWGGVTIESAVREYKRLKRARKPLAEG